MKIMVILTSLVMLVATSAMAVMNPDDNVIGLYWDPNGDLSCIEAVAYPVPLYIVLTNPTMETISGFECAFDIEADGQPYILGATFANPDALDVAAGFQNFIVGFGTPTVCEQATVLATLDILNALAIEVYFYLHQASPASIEGYFPVIVSDSVLMQMDVNHGVGFMTAYMAVGGCISPAEGSTWDQVKSMYR